MDMDNTMRDLKEMNLAVVVEEETNVVGMSYRPTGKSPRGVSMTDEERRLEDQRSAHEHGRETVQNRSGGSKGSNGSAPRMRRSQTQNEKHADMMANFDPMANFNPIA